MNEGDRPAREIKNIHADITAILCGGYSTKLAASDGLPVVGWIINKADPGREIGPYYAIGIGRPERLTGQAKGGELSYNQY